MPIEIKAPTFPESVADGTVATWHKKPGEAVSRDELIVDIETDKVVLEVVAPVDGVLANIIKGEGETVLSEELIAIIEEGAAAAAPAAKAEAAPTAAAAPVAAGEEPLLSPAARKLAEDCFDRDVLADKLIGVLEAVVVGNPSEVKEIAPR